MGLFTEDEKKERKLIGIGYCDNCSSRLFKDEHITYFSKALHCEHCTDIRTWVEDNTSHEVEGLMGMKVIDRNTLLIGVVVDYFMEFANGTYYVAVRYQDSDREDHALTLEEIMVLGG